MTCLFGADLLATWSCFFLFILKPNSCLDVNQSILLSSLAPNTFYSLSLNHFSQRLLDEG